LIVDPIAFQSLVDFDLLLELFRYGTFLCPPEQTVASLVNNFRLLSAAAVVVVVLNFL